MLDLIPLTWVALTALIVAAFHVWEIRERRQQRAQQVADLSRIVRQFAGRRKTHIHNGGAL